MKKILSFVSILLLFLLIFNSVCMATDINMNLEETTTDTTEEATTTTSTSSTTSATVTSAPTYTTVSGSSNSLNDGLTLTNIINIFVVVVGVVLILLGLAILVRLKY